MICTGKSGPNWLDRLRSSKGFPVSYGTDLENFLNPNPNSKNDDTEKDDRNSNGIEEMKVVETKKDVKKKKKNCEKEDLYDRMTSVLSELFNMGDSRNAHDYDKKRVSRKQKNPKLCVFSAATGSEDDCVPAAMSPTSVGNGWTEEKELGSGFGLELEEGENLKDRNSGYSRADVMIIDTSAPNWKSEKLVFRKENDWKVWERKSKCRKGFGCTRKRKSSQLSDSGRSVEKKKKKNKKTVLLPNEGSSQNDTTEAWRKTLHDVSQVPGKRLWFSRSPRKPAKKGSSVFHVQCTPSSRNNGDQLPN